MPVTVSSQVQKDNMINILSSWMIYESLENQ